MSRCFLQLTLVEHLPNLTQICLILLLYAQGVSQVRKLNNKTTVSSDLQIGDPISDPFINFTNGLLVAGEGR